MQLGQGSIPSAAMLEDMGYARLETPGDFSATFFVLHLYSVRGFMSPHDPMVFSSEIQQGVFATIGFGGQYNELSRLVTGDDLTDDESQFPALASHSSLLMIQLGPSSAQDAVPGYYKKSDGKILFEEKMFERAIAEIKAISAQILPPIIRSISIQIAPSHDLYFNEIRKITYGRTSRGEIAIRAPRASASMESIAGLSKESLEVALSLAISQLNPAESMESYWFALGLKEVDCVKRFLFFYLAIEAAVNKAFDVVWPRFLSGQLGRSIDAEDLCVLNQLAKEKGRNNIVMKFHIARSVLPSNLPEAETEAFREIHRARVDLAHGKVKELPSQETATAAFRLASRVLPALDIAISNLI